MSNKNKINSRKPILKFFRNHRFSEIAIYMLALFPQSPELTIAIRKLLEAEDAYLRCVEDYDDDVEDIEQNDKWITCSERLPDDQDESYIGYDAFYKTVGECRFSPTSNRLILVSGNFDDCDITHWQPLPSAAKE